MQTHRIDDKTIIFQTNCWYTEFGQVIIAREIDGDVQFSDISRGIYGYIKGCPFSSHSIHSRYLASDYTLDIHYKRECELQQIAKDNMHHVPPVERV